MWDLSLFVLLCLCSGINGGNGGAFQPDTSSKYKVTSILVRPYLIERSSPDGRNQNLTGNDRYEGLIADLLSNLSAVVDFDYEIQLVGDGKYGSQQNGSWNGMIGELVRNEVDLAAAPLTVTWEREDFIDFTDSFQKFGIAGIIQKPSDDVTYTKPSHIKDFPRESGVTYGTFRYGWIREQFRMSTKEPYKSIWTKLKGTNIESNRQGIEQVRKDPKFVYFLEESTADLLVGQEPCDLMKIQTDLPRIKRKYAFAVPTGVQLKEKVNKGIERLRDENVIQDLHEKWFQNACSGSQKTVLYSILTLLLLITGQSLL